MSEFSSSDGDLQVRPSTQVVDKGRVIVRARLCQLILSGNYVQREALPAIETQPAQAQILIRELYLGLGERNLLKDMTDSRQGILVRSGKSPLRYRAAGFDLLGPQIELARLASNPHPIKERNTNAHESGVTTVSDAQAQRIDSVLKDHIRLRKKLGSGTSSIRHQAAVLGVE